MTTYNASDGTILTAGSLELIPQFYSLKPTAYASTIGSSSAYTALGSEFISGNTFTERVLIHFSVLTTNDNLASRFRLLVSGAGMSGGSEVVGYSGANAGTAGAPISIAPYFSLGSNSGWIPGSDAVVFLEARHSTTGNLDYHMHSLTFWGTGKP